MLPKQEFLQAYDISEAVFEKARLEWANLEQIWEDHARRTSQLVPVANYFRDVLQQSPSVHSLKIRIKDPDHLIAKIIRKCAVDAKRSITPQNYRDEITDLIGVRALHLFKEEWVQIHAALCESWRRKEKPVANIRRGDPVELFLEAGCKIKEHPAGYRSVHYIVNINPPRHASM